jgi:hypothetical protein
MRNVTVHLKHSSTILIQRGGRVGKRQDNNDDENNDDDEGDYDDGARP